MRNDFLEYVDQFPSVAGAACTAALQQAGQMVNNLTQSDKGWKQILSIFNLCPMPRTPQNIAVMGFYFGVYTASLAQEDDPPTYPVEFFCDNITSSSNPLEAWGQFFITNFWQTSQCVDLSYATQIAELRDNTVYNNAIGGKSWYWQKCTEFGWFKTTNHQSIFYPQTDVAFLDDFFCKQVFFPDLPSSELIAWTNVHYGGRNLSSSSNILFTNGERDPWRHMSVTIDVSDSVTVSMYDAGHCVPYGPPQPSDTPSIIATRKDINNYIAELVEDNK